MFNDEEKKRLKQWSNVYGWTVEECIAAAETDETLGQLLDVEMKTDGMADEAYAIRDQITKIEICHHSFIRNVDRILHMIGTMAPDAVCGCGETDPELAAQLHGVMAAMAAWVDGKTEDAGDLAEVLGEQTPQKQWLVTCLCKTLAEQLKDCSGDEPLPLPKWPV